MLRVCFAFVLLRGCLSHALGIWPCSMAALGKYCSKHGLRYALVMLWACFDYSEGQGMPWPYFGHLAMESSVAKAWAQVCLGKALGIL